MTDIPAVRTQALSRRFDDLLAVDELDLAVPDGAIYGFLGPNGAGKTTTLRMILGLLRPDHGVIELFGRPLAEGRRRLLRQVGALVESPSLYDHLTGRENVDLTRRWRGLPRHQADEVLELVGLAADRHRLVRDYSLGMRQRLGLALALLGEPQLLILDEPINGLDPAGIFEVRELLVRLARERGVSVLVSSHLLNEMSLLADHIGILQQGRLLFQGTREELQARRGGRIWIGVDRPDEATAMLREHGFEHTEEPDEHGLLGVHWNSRIDGAAGELNTQLVRHGFQVHHFSIEAASLESLFLEMTQPQDGARLAQPAAST